MTYNKPSNLKFTQLAMYFDKHFWEDTDDVRNDDILYQYLYHILYMLACKQKWFKSFKDYDEFALFAATKLYIRFMNRRNLIESITTKIIEGVYFDVNFDYDALAKNIREFFEKKKFNTPNMFDNYNWVITEDTEDISIINECKKCIAKALSKYSNEELTFKELVVLFNNSGLFLDPKVKSCLNYCKSCLHNLKCSYQEESFCETYNADYLPEGSSEAMAELQKDNVQHEYDWKLRNYIIDQFQELPLKAKKIVNECPYANDPIIAKNLYISLLLSFLNSITLPNISLEKLEKKEAVGKDIYNAKRKLYTNEMASPIVLWNFGESYKQYLQVLLVKLKKSFAKELQETRSAFELSDETITDIMMSVYADPTKEDLYD